MKILITGAGTLAEGLIGALYGGAERLVIYSRNEHRQADLSARFPDTGKGGARWCIGDVRDYQRLKQAIRTVDYVIHTAALKRVPECEYNPQEAIATNVQGSMNVANACNECGIKKAVFISTDKAVNPVNLYGATKLCAEKYWIASNGYGPCKFSVVRYGNVIGSKGSVLPYWNECIKQGKPLPITDKRMTRFWIDIKDVVWFILETISIMQGGEIYLPKIGRRSMLDMAWEVNNDWPVIETGIRPGEKLHESLLNEEEARNCYDMGTRFVVFPTAHAWTADMKRYGNRVKDGFTLTSEG